MSLANFMRPSLPRSTKFTLVVFPFLLTLFLAFSKVFHGSPEDWASKMSVDDDGSGLPVGASGLHCTREEVCKHVILEDPHEGVLNMLTISVSCCPPGTLVMSGPQELDHGHGLGKYHLA